MRGYVERQECLQKSGNAYAGYREVADSMRTSSTSETHKPKRGLCLRCLRSIPVESLNGRYCIDRHDCAKALLALIKYRKERDDG